MRTLNFHLVLQVLYLQPLLCINMICLLFLVFNFLVGFSETYITFDCGNGNAKPFHQLQSLDVIRIIKVNELNNEDKHNREVINKINRLSDVLYQKCHKFYNMKKILVPNLNNSVETTRVMISIGMNFINLFGHDDIYFKTNNNDDFNNIIHAGEIYDKAEIVPFTFKPRNINYYNVFATNFSVLTDSKNCSEDLRDKDWTINKTHDDLPVAKIMTKAVYEMNSRSLFDFVTKLHYFKDEIKLRHNCSEVSHELTDLKTVLICLDNMECLDALKPISRNLIFKNSSTENCLEEINKLKHNLLVVMAPKPFQLDYEFMIPTVFYKTTHINPEDKAQFLNSVNLIDNSLLKYGFIKFIKDMGWRRVAVISDDAPYSGEFEKDILELFYEHGIIYNVQRCETRHCDFKKAVSNLAAMDARIIIVNVDENNAEKVFENAKPYKKFTLLYRVWPFWDTWTEQSRSLFIALGPPNVDYMDCYRHYFRKDPFCSGIGHGLKAIDYAHSFVRIFQSVLLNSSVGRTIHHIEKMSRKYFFRHFAKDVSRAIKPGATAYVVDRIISPDNVLAIMTIDHRGNVRTEKEYTGSIAEDRAPCLAKTNKFDKPCDIYIIIYFMFVVILLSLLILVITCYFHSSSPIHAIAYTQL